MVVLKNGKKYYTLEEAKLLSDTQIEKDANAFARKVIQMQKENTSVKEFEYA